ncbi:hypothetical protein ESA94_02715 [Lacibacter luteus]|uniref:Uncharacterized protein n=1 Tax=Lacibacter luteus TaxID=2508719 RepID=A0A4V1M7Y2_9BACT|nr:hypothetical protein [Lacibacter luteus]RXK61942.1 hypothetical protein ESA94_02715 [Lacibacter luteus]
MKIKALILLIGFIGLLTGTESFAVYLETVKQNRTACNATQPVNEEQNKDACCCNNTVSTACLLQKEFTYTQVTAPTVKHVADVVNHYSMFYLVSVWRPPALLLYFTI